MGCNYHVSDFHGNWSNTKRPPVKVAFLCRMKGEIYFLSKRFFKESFEPLPISLSDSTVPLPISLRDSTEASFMF